MPVGGSAVWWARNGTGGVRSPRREHAGSRMAHNSKDTTESTFMAKELQCGMTADVLSVRKEMPLCFSETYIWSKR